MKRLLTDFKPAKRLKEWYEKKWKFYTRYLSTCKLLFHPYANFISL